MAQIGETVPDCVFTRPDGNSATLANYAGRKLIVYFYPKDDTTGCTREAQDFTAMVSDFALANISVLGISRDSVKSHAKFASKYELKIDLGSDLDGSMCEAFGVWIQKSMYGRTYMGIERATFLIGTDGKIAHIWHKVKVAGHAAAVLEVARAL